MVLMTGNGPSITMNRNAGGFRRHESRLPSDPYPVGPVASGSGLRTTADSSGGDESELRLVMGKIVHPQVCPVLKC